MTVHGRRDVIIVSMIMSQELLALADARAELCAGTANSGCAVRLLDNVTLVVSAGDLVVVQSREPASQWALLTALEGRSVRGLRRVVQASRRADPSLRIRRAAIRAAAVVPIEMGWRLAQSRAASGSAKPVVASRGALYLLRATREGPLAPGEHDAWMTWSRQLREAGGAIVVTTASSGPPRGAALRAAHEPPVTPYGAAELSCSVRGECQHWCLEAGTLQLLA